MGKRSLAENVINLKSLTRIYELHFRCPKVMKINQKNADNVQYEIVDGVGKAWVPARDIVDAKRKLHAILTISEWIDV
jgi:hypothetical protein